MTGYGPASVAFVTKQAANARLVDRGTQLDGTVGTVGHGRRQREVDAELANEPVRDFGTAAVAHDRQQLRRRAQKVELDTDRKLAVTACRYRDRAGRFAAGEAMTVEAEWGFMIVTKYGISGWMRPGAGVGTDRPYSWNFEAGIKFVWR